MTLYVIILIHEYMSLQYRPLPTWRRHGQGGEAQGKTLHTRNRKSEFPLENAYLSPSARTGGLCAGIPVSPFLRVG